jgi:hypothetical protein
MIAKDTRRTTIIVLAALFVPTLADAQVPALKSSNPLSVELSGVALPVTRNGVLVNYLFGVINIQMGDSASTFFLRENSYLLRDAIVRIASRSPIPTGPTPGSFDRVAVTGVVVRAVQAVRPNARVVRVTVEDAALMRN